MSSGVLKNRGKSSDVEILRSSRGGLQTCRFVDEEWRYGALEAWRRGGVEESRCRRVDIFT